MNNNNCSEQTHEHVDGHDHDHESFSSQDSRHKHHATIPEHDVKQKIETALTIRSHSGLSGDMLMTGLALMNMAQNNLKAESDEGALWFNQILALVLPKLAHTVQVQKSIRDGIAGWQARTNLPHEHEHRNLADIQKIIGDSGICGAAKTAAAKCFELLAECEASTHGKQVQEVHFHEVGALDSILDICIVCELYARLGAARLVCSPLPMADGQIACAHGIMPAPAPAVIKLMEGMAVCAFAGKQDAGELVTPTAAALLRTLNADFGPWPQFHVKHTALVYGQRHFANTANGAIFAVGTTRPPYPA